jgi:hypothetical protein
MVTLAGCSNAMACSWHFGCIILSPFEPRLQCKSGLLAGVVYGGLIF